MKLLRYSILAVGMCLVLSGCSHVFNPYKSKWSCPPAYKGKCMEVQDAYQESMAGTDDVNAKAFRDKVARDTKVEKKGSEDDIGCSDCGIGGQGSSQSQGFISPSCDSVCANKKDSKDCQECLASLPKPSDEMLYKGALFKEMKSIIEQPRTPMLKQPEVLRILVLGYTGDGNEFFSHRYLYTIVSEPRWVLDPVQEVR